MLKNRHESRPLNVLSTPAATKWSLAGVKDVVTNLIGVNASPYTPYGATPWHLTPARRYLSAACRRNETNRKTGKQTTFGHLDSISGIESQCIPAPTHPKGSQPFNPKPKEMARDLKRTQKDFLHRSVENKQIASVLHTPWVTRMVTTSGQVRESFRSVAVCLREKKQGVWV